MHQYKLVLCDAAGLPRENELEIDVEYQNEVLTGDMLTVEEKHEQLEIIGREHISGRETILYAKLSG